MTVPRKLLEKLEKENIVFRCGENVAACSSFKVGGVTEIAIYPDSRDRLTAALRLLSDYAVRYEVIGNASNLLFAFDRFEGALVFTSGISRARIEGARVIAECGRSLTGVAELAAKSSLEGLEFAYGIPGLVGGAVYMNAGAYGGDVSSVLEYSVAYDTDSGETVKISDHSFGYRRSIYMNDPSLICLEAVFLLRRGDERLIRERMRANMTARREKQPLELPNAGSYFKRPEGHFAGKLIEDCGLKGMSVGGAQVSEKHAGFIVNRGGATADDILALEEKIKEIVMSRYGVALEREVRLIR